jgi:ABC-type multidrug transport system fused ATPase/permease subunit
MAGLNRLVEGRTTILITHSAALARNADQVAVMAAGRVVEYGVPEQLLATDSAFLRLTGTQRRSDVAHSYPHGRHEALVPDDRKADRP